jgi:hypothetical protein
MIALEKFKIKNLYFNINFYIYKNKKTLISYKKIKNRKKKTQLSLKTKFFFQTQVSIFTDH